LNNITYLCRIWYNRIRSFTLRITTMKPLHVSLLGLETDFSVLVQRIHHVGQQGSQYELNGRILLGLEGRDDEISMLSFYCFIRFQKRAGFSNDYITKHFTVSDQMEIVCKSAATNQRIPLTSDLQRRLQDHAFILEVGISLGYQYFLPQWMNTPEITSGVTPIELLSYRPTYLSVMASLFYDNPIGGNVVMCN